MSWLLGGLVFAGATACSGDDDTKSTKETEKSPVENEVPVRRLTITEVEGDAADAKQALTRATLADQDGELTALWTADDRLTYCNLSRTNPNTYEPYTGPLTAASTAAISQFTGDVACITGDYLAVVYPATTFEKNDSYTISLSGQKGTLSGLATNYHYVYGKAYVTSVTETTATAEMVRMKSLLTVCKFSFEDKATGYVLPITTLEISYGGAGSDQNTYPQTATVAVSDDTEPEDIHAIGVEGSTIPLSISAAEGATEVYVALLPSGGKRTFNFTVTNDSGTYSGTAKATLNEGEYMEATGLKLTKQ